MLIQVKILIFATGWMLFRAIGSGLFLSLTFLGSPRSAPPEWIIAFLGDFMIGTSALFLAYLVWKKPSSFLWGILLAWNSVGIFDLIGALSLTFTTPYSPLPEIGLNEIGVRIVLSLNTIIQLIALIIMFRPQVKSYFNLENHNSLK